MPSDPLAYFLTMRCFGSWLPGDPRGTTDRAHNTFGEPHIPRDDMRRRYAANQAKQAEIVFDTPMRDAVTAAILQVCEDRGWQVWALNVRTNHAHVVLTADLPASATLNRLKSSATSSLRKLGLAAATARLWSRDGSKIYLWTDAELAATVDYTLNRQD